MSNSPYRIWFWVCWLQFQTKFPGTNVISQIFISFPLNWAATIAIWFDEIGKWLWRIDTICVCERVARSLTWLSLYLSLIFLINYIEIYICGFVAVFIYTFVNLYILRYVCMCVLYVFCTFHDVIMRVISFYIYFNFTFSLRTVTHHIIWFQLISFYLVRVCRKR